jgi:hypothetical protein
MSAHKKRNLIPLLIILNSIILVFAFSRLLTFLIMETSYLPEYLFAQIGNFRLHHFVYGNIIIVITSFLAIGLGINKHRNLFAVFYGIGLGLILDEFLLWMGNVEELTRNTLWIPHSLTAVSTVSLIIATIIMIDLYQIRAVKKIKKNVKKSS